MRKLRLSLTISLLVCTGILFSQITSGAITLNVTGVEMAGNENQDEIAAMRSLLKEMNMTIYFQPGEQVNEMNKMMGTIDVKTYFKDGQMTQFQDNMGQKIKVVTPLETEITDTLVQDSVEMKGIYDIRYDKESTIDILGYECYKAIIKLNKGTHTHGGDMPEKFQNRDMVWYVTDAIEINNFKLQEMLGLTLKGTPLLFSIDTGRMAMTFEATHVETSVEQSAFEEPAGNYKVVTSEELKQMEINSN